MINPWTLFDLIDLFGVFVGAFTGALVARRHGYDITGHWGLALVTGLGGGLIRDVCLQVGPPVALTEPAYLPIVAIATLAGAFYGHRVDQSRGPIVFMDSIALVVFAVAGSLRTINHDFSAWSTVLLGVITAVGGGVLRDVLTGDTPMIFRRGELYAFAALGASVAMVTAEALGASKAIFVLAGFGVGLALRFGSLRYGWTAWVPREEQERMRIGIITDVHANLPALEAALAALDGAGCDLIVHTGDAIGIGPHPAEVLDVLLGRPDVHCLMGNHDEWFAFGLPPSHREWMSPEEEVHQRWVHAGLREDLRAQVGAWPFAVEDEVEGIRLWFGHYPRASDGSGFASFVPEPVPSDLDRLFAPVQADLVFYGHHHPRSDLTGQRRYVNPGSLGCHAPGRARFAILDLERGAWDLRLEAVPYDPAPVLRDLEARDVPARETIRRIFFSDPP